MRLYHFTSPNALRAIYRHGLTIGDVPTDLVIGSPGLIAVWLTESPKPEGHGLGGMYDKGRCRLEVSVEITDSKLKRWSHWALDHVSPACRRRLIETDGHAWRSWFVYFGWIPPERIFSMTDLYTGEVFTEWGDSFPAIEHIKGVPFWDRARWHKRMLKRCMRVLEQSSAERSFASAPVHVP